MELQTATVYPSLKWKFLTQYRTNYVNNVNEQMLKAVERDGGFSKDLFSRGNVQLWSNILYEIHSKYQVRITFPIETKIKNEQTQM